jgi:hypothetical protein
MVFFSGGTDCSLLACPVHKSWFGLVRQNHTFQAECSGIGSCDYTTGECSNCGGNGYGIFGGKGCEFLTCPSLEDSVCRLKLFIHWSCEFISL